MPFETLTLETKGAIAVLTLNQPDSLNAVSLTMIDDLSAALDVLCEANTEIRCLVMTGAGRAFCAGANLADGRMAENMANPDRDLGQMLETGYHPILRKLRDLPFPFITSVNGGAAGIGMSFALMGDLILAAKSAYFLQAFRHIGLVPDGGSTWLLPRLIGRARAIELSLLGEKLSAERALEWGLINRVYDDDRLMDETMALAQSLADGPTRAMGLIRKAYWQSFENTYEDQLSLERDLQRQAGRTEDFVEGVSAFIVKRKAKFKGS